MASAVAIRPITPGVIPIAEKRSGSSDPMTPAPTMTEAVLISGGATRHGRAPAGGRGSGRATAATVVPSARAPQRSGK